MMPLQGPPLAMPRMGGFLRSLVVVLRTSSGRPPELVLRHAADRTRSRRRAAGSRRTKRYGLRPIGPAGRITIQVPDWPWNRIESVPFNSDHNPAPYQLDIGISEFDRQMLLASIRDTREPVIQVITKEILPWRQ